MQLGLQHGARGVAGDFAVRCGREPDQLGMCQHGAFKPREQTLVARPVVAVPARPDDFFFERAMQLARREGRSLLGHRPEHGAGIAGADRGAQLAGILPAQRNDAAMLTLIVQGPIGKLDLAALEIVGATGRGIDLRSDDVNVGVFLVIVGDEDGLGVLHAERLKRGARRLFHLLAGWRLARPPGDRKVHAILLASPGAAFLVKRIEFHHPPGAFGIGRGRDVKAKRPLPAYPGDPALLIWRQLFQLPRLRIAALAQHIAHRARYAATDIDPGIHRCAAAALKVQHVVDRPLVQIDGFAQAVFQTARLTGRVELPRNLVEIVAARRQFTHKGGGLGIALPAAEANRGALEQQLPRIFTQRSAPLRSRVRIQRGPFAGRKLHRHFGGAAFTGVVSAIAGHCGADLPAGRDNNSTGISHLAALRFPTSPSIHLPNSKPLHLWLRDAGALLRDSQTLLQPQSPPETRGADQSLSPTHSSIRVSHYVATKERPYHETAGQ